MIATKAVLTMVLMAAGGATAGSIVHMQAGPRSSTPATPAPVAMVSPQRPMAPPSVAPDEGKMVVLEQVNIVANVPREIARAPRARPEPAAEPMVVPCSSWGGLATGPEGRQVRKLCFASR